MKPTRTFSANSGDYSVDNAGPDAIERDIDAINRMFDPFWMNMQGETGGIGEENLKSSAVTDGIIGNRTIDQGTAEAYANTGYLTQILSWFAKVMKEIKGTGNWYDVPANPMTELATNSTVNNLAGTGRTTETIMSNANNIATLQSQYTTLNGTTIKGYVSATQPATPQTNDVWIVI